MYNSGSVSASSVDTFLSVFCIFLIFPVYINALGAEQIYLFFPNAEDVDIETFAA